MITRDQLMYAIATAIHDRQDLYIDTYARSSADDDDFAYVSACDDASGYTLLLSVRDFIARCIDGEAGGNYDHDYISAQDIKAGWDGDADMPSIKQIREYVAACDSNDNFADMIETLEDMDVLPHHEGSSITYTLTRDEVDDVDDTLDMTCSLRRPDGSVVGEYHCIKDEDEEMWTVDTMAGPDWDDITGMTTNRARAVWDEDDNEELDRCYYRTRIIIRIWMPSCIAGLTDEEVRALYIAHERKDAVAAASHMARTAAQPYTLSRSVELLNLLINIATDETDAVQYSDEPEREDEYADGVRHYPAHAQIESSGKNAEEYLRAVSMLSGRTPDDAESDEDTIWHYYNA